MANQFSDRKFSPRICREKANEMLEKFWCGSTPVNSIQIAKEAGLTVRAGEGLELRGCNSRISTEDGETTILYTGNDPAQRQRFAVAHCLGHHALGHTNVPSDPVSHYKTGKMVPSEVAANRFALCLLMPKRLLIQMREEKPEIDQSDVCDHFEVDLLLAGPYLGSLGYAPAGQNKRRA